MRKRKVVKSLIAIISVMTVAVSGIPMSGLGALAATVDFYDESSAVMLDSGGFKTEIYGVGTDDWGVTYADRKETLPPATTYLTDKYRETVGTVPTNDWASSVVFDKYSESLYAHPLAYRAASNGMQMSSPAVTDTNSYVDGEPAVEALLNDETVELVVGADGFTAKDARVDKTTDWTYEIIMENSAQTSSMRAILAKGTPYAYYKFENLNPTISLGAGATNFSVYKNNTTSNIIGISLKNLKDGKMHYYIVAAPSGTTWTNAGGKLKASLPSGKNYMSIGILPDNTDAAFDLYAQYAFNFITDTKIEWEYLENASKVATRYNVTTTNMETGVAGGDTIIALYPHQWRYADETYTGYTYSTIRGTMKTIVGSSYITQMTYNGILSTLPVTADEATIGTIKDQLGYLYDYRKNKGDPKWIAFLEGQYGGYDTYWVGKNLNTLADAILLAGQFEDEDMKTITSEMVAGTEGYLEFWFDPFQAYISGNFVESYFYYHEEYGTLIGYPASYSSDKEVNDHHFHYGYWIKAASVIAMNDPAWAEEWGGMVYEMISDIANINRDGSSYNDNSTAKYPFLRNFDIYEGHSWASGVANYEFDENGNMVDIKGGLAGGNNQESSSEATNAWASLIMWGEVMEDKEIRDLGIYLYTTEIAAIEDYYFDVHDEIFTSKYEDRDNYDIQSVTRLFGGRYDHTAWWTENSIEVSTILMLPISGATLYLGKYPEKVKALSDSVSETSKQWAEFVNNKNQICTNYGKVDMLTDPETNQDIMAEYYAFYDPDEALNRFDISDTGKVENGESRAHTLAFITSLKEYGQQNYDITASSPFAMVFEKDGVRTYVAENFTNSNQRVYFSDGAYVDVSAKSTYEGAKAGDEDNPNIDEGEIVGSKQKYILETYLENLDATGYDMTSRYVSVKSETDTYTYEPVQINGFTFEADNKENVLTVNVAEGTLETVKVYYSRNSYTVTYSLSGGTNSSENPNEYKYGESYEFSAPVKSGYVFKGWYTDTGYTSQITQISATMAGNLKLYACFVDENTIANYTIEHYKQSADRSTYELVESDTEIIEGIVGATVAAQEKSYLGYVLNENSVISGTVLAGNKLVLRLYYDIEAKEIVMTEKGVMVDENSHLIMYVADAPDDGNVLMYYMLCADEASAVAAYEQAVASNGNNLPGYNITDRVDGVFKKNIGEVSDEKYIVFRFNIPGVELTDIQMMSIKEVKNQTVILDEASYTVHYYLQNKSLSGYNEVISDKMTLTGTVGRAVVAPVNSYEGYYVNDKISTIIGTVAADNNLELHIYYDVAATFDDEKKTTIEINGCQINATVEGMRTVYSVEDIINDMEVVERGMVYSLADYASEDELYVGSESKYVRSYQATDEGKLSENFSTSATATSYAMTMKFAVGTAAEFCEEYRVRAYAKLSDGSYVYSNYVEYTVYSIADELYQNSLMNTETAHNCLYTNILSVVNPEYQLIPYAESKNLVLADY